MRRNAVALWTVTGLLVAVTCVAGSLSCSGDREQRIFADRDRLVVAVKNDQPGTGYMEDSKRSGFDVQLARDLTGDLRGVNEPGWEDVRSEDRGTVIADGRADLVIATMSITEDRSDDMDFVGPYARTQQGFLVRDEDVGRFTSLEDLAGEPICSWKGTTSIAELERSNLGAGAYEENDASDCIEDLLSGAARAVSTDQLILYGFAQHETDLQVLPNLTIGSINDWGIGISPERRDDCARIADWLKDYVTSTAWDDAFRNNLPSAIDANAQWQNDFRPDVTLIDTYSCQGTDG